MLSDRLVAAIKLLEVGSARSAVAFRRETYRLQEAFMRFTQRYWFTEVSDQAQTRDLFRMQRLTWAMTTSTRSSATRSSTWCSISTATCCAGRAARSTG